MARGIKYTCGFKSGNGYTCGINIYAEGFTGTAVSVTPADNPVWWEDDNNKNVLQPIRYKTGYIRLIEHTAGELDDIFPTDRLDRYVTVAYNGSIVFRGYIQQKEFSSPWGGAPLVREFPIISPLGLLGDLTFPTYDPPQPLTVREALAQICSTLDAGISRIYTPNGNGSAALDLIMSSLTVCPFNPDHAYAIDNPEPLFRPETMEYLIEGVCNLYGWHCYDVPDGIMFTACNYGGFYCYYPVTESEGTVTLGDRRTLEDSGDDMAVIDGPFRPIDRNAKLSRIESARSVTFEYEGEVSVKSEHDFNRDTFSSGSVSGESATVNLTAYNKEILSSPPASVRPVLFSEDSDSMDELMPFQYNDSVWEGMAQLILDQSFFLTSQHLNYIRIKMKWGSGLADLGNEKLDNDLWLLVTVVCRRSVSSGPPLYYLNNPGGAVWQWTDTAGRYTTFAVPIDASSDDPTGEIKVAGSQTIAFIPVPSPPADAAFEAIEVIVQCPAANSNFDQASHYSIKITSESEQSVTRDGVTYRGEVATALISDLFRQRIDYNTEGKDIRVSQNFSASVYAVRQVRPTQSGQSVAVVPPAMLSAPQTRLVVKTRGTGSAYAGTYTAYLTMWYWNSWWRSRVWRLLAMKFSPWDDEYTLTLHRSPTLE